MDSRLYLIRPKADPGALGRLVEAKHPSQALRHVASDTFSIELPSALEAAALVKKGVTVEDSSAKPDLPTDPF